MMRHTKRRIFALGFMLLMLCGFGPAPASPIGTYTRDDARWGTVTLTIAPDRRVTVESKQGDDCPNTADFHCWEVLRNDEQVIEAWSMYCDQPQHCRVERYATVAVAFAADYSVLTLYGVTQGRYWHYEYINIR